MPDRYTGRHLPRRLRVHVAAVGGVQCEHRTSDKKCSSHHHHEKRKRLCLINMATVVDLVCSDMCAHLTCLFSCIFGQWYHVYGWLYFYFYCFKPRQDGAACPSPEDRTCPVDCVSSFGPWTTCSKTTGRQSRTATVTRNPMNGGTVWYVGGGGGSILLLLLLLLIHFADSCCFPFLLLLLFSPPPEDRTCVIDCEYQWQPWSDCNLQTGKQQRSVTVITNPLNAGIACPAPEERTCAIDCAYSWGSWSTW